MGGISKASILVDNDSWILSHIHRLVSGLEERGLDTHLVRKQEDIPPGDACFLLGCTGIVGPENLSRNRHNLVVHESALPAGKGFAPMTWQILEGKNDIPICLIEASDEIDGGRVWLRDIIHLEGHELCAEWREKQASKTFELCLRFIDEHATLTPTGQSGEETFYPRRRAKDSELDTGKSIVEQFQLLRTVDNQHYPAFFIRDGVKYVIEIRKHD